MSPSPSLFLRRILAVGVVLGAAWCVHSQWLDPLRQREAGCLRAVADIGRNLVDARAQIERIGKEEKEVAHARGLLNSLLADVPREPTEVWLPVRLRTHLRGAGIAEVTIRMNSVAPDSGVPGYERSYWNVNLPKQPGMRDTRAVLRALAELERKEPFVRILDVSFGSDSGEPDRPTGSLNVTALVPK